MGVAAGLGGIMTVVYLLVALISFFFALYLFQFGTRIKSAVASYDVDELTNALGKLKSFFKLWGIITIVYIAFTVLYIIAAVVMFGVFASRY